MTDSQWHLRQGARIARHRARLIEELGVLHLYPFKKGQLGGLLKKAGFTNIRVYRDLDWTQPYDLVKDEGLSGSLCIWRDLRAHVGWAS